MLKLSRMKGGTKGTNSLGRRGFLKLKGCLFLHLGLNALPVAPKKTML